MYVQNIAASLQDTRHRVLFGYLSLNRSEPLTPQRSLTACYGRLTYPQRTSQTTEVAAKLSRIGLIKKLTRFFFRGHPKCQRSSPKSERGSLLGARDFSDAHHDAQATGQGFFTSSSNRCQALACARDFLAGGTPPGHLSGGRQSWPLGGG
jgi:uncharacterized protein (DUF924 family)